jgi:hypothetical protein
MAEAFYSVVLDHPADAVWAMIRPFGHYAWAGVDAESASPSSTGAPASTVPPRSARWLEQFEQKGFAVWLAALRRFMESRA